MPWIAVSEGVKRCFRGAFKNYNPESAIFVKIRDKRGDMEILTKARSTPKVSLGYGSADFIINRSQIKFERVVDGEGVEQGIKPFYAVARLRQKAGVGKCNKGFIFFFQHKRKYIASHFKFIKAAV